MKKKLLFIFNASGVLLGINLNKSRYSIDSEWT